MRGLMLSLVLLLAGPVLAQDRQPQVRELGDGRYGVGRIVVDRAEGRFTVPGRVLELDGPDSPLEFLAVTRGGMKAYETLLELEADAFEFNLACLLIGLDPAGAEVPEQHFDTREVRGQPVTLSVSWQQDGQTITRPPLELMKLEGGPVTGGERWVYTGSSFDHRGEYLAQVYGTLIGFVHAPGSIIEHVTGLGLGNYGAVVADRDRMPPPGSPVELTVRR